MDEVLNTILQNTYSLTLFKDRIRLLKAYLLQTFFGGEHNPAYNPGLSSSKPGLNNISDEPWLVSLPPAFFQKFNKNNVYEIFTIMEKEAAQFKILIMYLPFEPDNATITQLGMLTRKTFNFPYLLLDIKFSPNLIAGAALSWKGIYRDYSLRARIAEKGTEISESFRRFLR